MIGLAWIVILVGAFCLVSTTKESSKQQVTEPARAKAYPTIGQMVEMSDAELGRMDIATVILLCTPSVPGFAPVDLEKCLRTLDYMVEGVRNEAARNWHRFLENPAESENSEAYFKVAMMITVLCQDFKVAYNPEKIQPATLETLKDKTFYSDPDDVFLSGMIGNRRLGTCSSIPVLCVAVGRRLGYPLKLAAAKGHLFFRWEDAKERRNFECTHAVNCISDEEYRKWPFPITDDEIEKGHYLRNFTPREELACFLSIRA